MNPDIKAKWIEALRSGKYAQGKGYLRTNEDAYCCLGVLCNVVGVKWSNNDTYRDVYLAKTKRGKSVSFLPADIAQNLSITRQGILTEMNDGGKSFSEIADYIEKHL